jgi:hypothetical protein
MPTNARRPMLRRRRRDDLLFDAGASREEEGVRDMAIASWGFAGGSRRPVRADLGDTGSLSSAPDGVALLRRRRGRL